MANNNGKMERSRLRASTGMRYALLNPSKNSLAGEGRKLSIDDFTHYRMIIAALKDTFALWKR
jgi:hypothetical protein